MWGQVPAASWRRMWQARAYHIVGFGPIQARQQRVVAGLVVRLHDRDRHIVEIDLISIRGGLLTSHRGTWGTVCSGVGSTRRPHM